MQAKIAPDNLSPSLLCWKLAFLSHCFVCSRAVLARENWRWTLVDLRLYCTASVGKSVASVCCSTFMLSVKYFNCLVRWGATFHLQISGYFHVVPQQQRLSGGQTELLWLAHRGKSVRDGVRVVGWVHCLLISVAFTFANKPHHESKDLLNGRGLPPAALSQFIGGIV